jgi:hypothetical protein
MNRSTEAGNRDEVDGVVTISLKLHRNGTSLLCESFRSWLHRLVRSLLQKQDHRAQMKGAELTAFPTSPCIN